MELVKTPLSVNRPPGSPRVQLCYKSSLEKEQSDLTLDLSLASEKNRASPLKGNISVRTPLNLGSFAVSGRSYLEGDYAVGAG